MVRVNVMEQVAAELEHIPWWPGEHQGLLRAIYRMFRANSLGAKWPGTASAVLHRCLATIRRDYPTAPVAYDRAFFQGDPRGARPAEPGKRSWAKPRSPSTGTGDES
jgi:hypothetical protein